MIKNPTTRGMITGNRHQWLVALRSSEYQQGTCVLKSTDLTTNTESFCCLGVACNLYDSNAWNNGHFIVTGEDFRLEDSTSPPEQVAFILGLFNADVEECMQWNDSLGYSFYQIAYLLAKKWSMRGQYDWDKDQLGIFSSDWENVRP